MKKWERALQSRSLPRGPRSNNSLTTLLSILEIFLDEVERPKHLTFVLPESCLPEATMSEPGKLTTTVSAKGQVVLPKIIRQSRRWDAGTRLAVEDTSEGVLLKPAPAFAPTRSADVFGCLARTGASRTLAEMDAGIMVEARRHHEGS